MDKRSKGDSSAIYTNVSGSGENPPLMEFTRNGILFLEEGNFELKNNSGSKKVENKQNPQIIEGPWKISFTKGWGAPDSTVLPGLTSWTEHKNKGIKYYSGIGKYQKPFVYEMNGTLSEDERIYIDLGDISEIAEVWMNGQSLGITWAKPFKFDVTGMIKNGENILTVEVANTWSNRIIGDAITGEKFTSTNITRVDRSTWDEVPLNPSGLLGPVSIQLVSLVK